MRRIGISPHSKDDRELIYLATEMFATESRRARKCGSLIKVAECAENAALAIRAYAANGGFDQVPDSPGIIIYDVVKAQAIQLALMNAHMSLKVHALAHEMNDLDGEDVDAFHFGSADMINLLTRLNHYIGIATLVGGM